MDETKGTCCENKVLANMPTELCPVQGFKPARKKPLQSNLVFEMVGNIQTKTVLDNHIKHKREAWLFK
jgi:hypothetical protein